MMFCFLFFFKQKTAYELRISDWSSDVCSSDLAPIPDKTADMAKANPLQEQLLKAGLVKKSKVAEVAREQHKARHGKGPAQPSDIQRDAADRKSVVEGKSV